MAQTDPAPPQPCGPHHNPAGLCCPLTLHPQLPCSTVLRAHRGKCSAGGQSSPGPADGPELQPVPSAVGRGRRTPASLWGQSSITPLPGGKGVPIPSSHIIWVSPSTAAVVGAGSLRVCWDIPGFVSLLPGTPSSAQRPVTSPDLPTAGQGHTRGMEQGSVCCCCTLPALKNKILSSLFLQVFPSYSS